VVEKSENISSTSRDIDLISPNKTLDFKNQSRT